MKKLSLTLIISSIFLLESIALSQPSERSGMRPGGRDSSQEAMITGEVIRIGETEIVLAAQEGANKELSFSRNISFVKETRVDINGMAVGDKVLVIGRSGSDDVISPLLIKITSDRESRSVPGRSNGPRGGGSGDGPIFGTISRLDPLFVDIASGGSRKIEITEATRIIKEIPISSSEIKVGSKVKVLSPPRPGMTKREAIKIMLLSEDAEQPGRRPSVKTYEIQRDLLPDLPQQPINADFVYSAWIGRGMYTNAELDRAFKVARNTGVRHLKVEFKWNVVEPKNNEFTWNNSDRLDVEHIIKLAKQYGMAIIPYFEPFMPWGDKKILNRDNGECEGPPSRLGQSQSPDPAEYAQYVFAVVDRLKKAEVPVGFVELDNETTNVSDGDQSWNCYVNMTAKQVKQVQNAAYDKIKSVYPDIKISSTTFSFPGAMVNKPDVIKKDRNRKNSLVKAYFAEEPRPKFDFLGLHEVLGGSGNPYTTLEPSNGYEYNFGSYNEAYDMWRAILDNNGYKSVPIMNTESAAIINGKQDAQLIQRVIFARTNAAKNNIKGLVLSQITGSAAFTAGGEVGGNILVGITRLADGYVLREGYFGFYTLMKILPNYPIYRGRFSGELNQKGPIVEKFSDKAGNILYTAFVPYDGSKASEPKKISLRFSPGENIEITRSDSTITTMQADDSGTISLSIDEHPVFVKNRI